ncbi:MAG: ABC transporter permease [Oscillospiraceae bacterium]|nr:ABC transporter permease [Oscillospiraceae bacterium]
MFFFENIRLAFGAILQNKMRTLLTMLGIIIGISSVITITTIGNSLTTILNKTFTEFGAAGYYINYDTKMNDDGYYYDWTDLRDEDFVTPEIIKAMKEQFNGRFLISETEHLGSAIIRNSKGQTITASVSGDSEGAIVSDSQTHLLSGRQLTEQDSEQQKNAIIVSELFVKQYFVNGENPINQTITLDITGVCTADFVIVGVVNHPQLFDKMLQPGTATIDKISMMSIPYGTALHLLGKQAETDRYPSIILNDSTISDADGKEELQAFFDQAFANNQKLDVIVRSNAEDMKIINIVMTVITVMISVIAGISLLVGGIGVMNIMLVSITERTREIGIRKAIGAQRTTIRTQFIIEAIILCLTGGLIGILLGLLNGIGLGALGNYIFQTMYAEYADLISITVTPSPLAILISLGFSMLIGVFFGSYPASKAAKLDPIEALRYE